MNAPSAAIRSHPAVIISIVVAATAVTACALVAIAWMLGWIPSRQAAVAKKASVTVPARAAAPASAGPELGLLPGESLVSTEELARRAPAVPAAPAIPATTSAPQKSPAPPRAAAPPAKPAALPATRPPQPTSYERAARAHCVNCGTVTSITAFAAGTWDVHVRFEDGSTETLRYRAPPGLRIGQRVLLEEGRLVPN